jgi:hypothetical protein
MPVSQQSAHAPSHLELSGEFQLASYARCHSLTYLLSLMGTLLRIDRSCCETAGNRQMKKFVVVVVVVV